MGLAGDGEDLLKRADPGARARTHFDGSLSAGMEAQSRCSESRAVGRWGGDSAGCGTCRSEEAAAPPELAETAAALPPCEGWPWPQLTGEKGTWQNTWMTP